MIDHINIPVTNLPRAEVFYDAVLAKLKMSIVARDGPAVGYGRSHWQFGIIAQDHPVQPLHVAFAAATHAQVEAFYAAALEVGGSCNGPPGGRPEYGARYFAAFVIDPDGHNIEAVCRT